MQYTVIAVIYANGTTQYIAIDGTGTPLNPQPDLSSAIPCPTETTEPGGGNNAPDCCPDYSTATLQTQNNALVTTANNVLAGMYATLQAILTQVSAPVSPTPYKIVHGIIGSNSGTLSNPFVLPAGCISAEVIPLAVNPATLAPYNAATLLGNKITDDAGNVVTLAVLSSWKAERRQLTGGAWQPIGGTIKIEATAGGAIFIIYEII